MRAKFIWIIVTAIALPLTGLAEDTNTRNMKEDARARMADGKEGTYSRRMVDEAADVYSRVVKGPHGEIPRNVVEEARCIVVLPSLLTGAFVVGGTHGDGLATCKDGNNNWSQPAVVSLTQASFGLQAGAKSADLVLFFVSDDSARALKRGDFTLGADVSAVAGTYGTNVDTSNTGVVMYSQSEGVYAGASLNGGRITKNDDGIEKYYGKKVDYTGLLEGREKAEEGDYSNKLIRLFS